MNGYPETPKTKILALDDALLMREALSQILSADYDLVLAGTHADFLEKIPDYNPNIILMDLNLPDGNGIDICRELRKDRAYEETAIIIITGSTDTKTIEECYNAGADDFIRKPFIPYELRAKVGLFEKSIRSREQMIMAYLSQVEMNRKLNTFTQIVQENIITRDIESSFKTAEELSNIISCGYIEILRKEEGGNQSLVRKVCRKDAKYRPFSELDRILDITEGLTEKTKTIKIKSGESSIYCLVIPLLLNREVFGYILLENSTPFSEEDLRIIDLFSNFFTIIHNRFSVERAIEKMNNEYKNEISKVRRIQVSSLPDFSRIKGYDISAAYIPAQDISGDFFDATFIDDDIYQIILCDVSGHGIASSYIGNQIRTLFKTVSAQKMGPSAIVKAVNDAIASDLDGLYYYATAVVLHIWLKEGVIRYVNAGHPPILHYREKKNRCERLKNNGPLVGLFRDNQYMEEEIVFDENDSLLLYTDGVTEAGAERYQDDRELEMFGEERLSAIFRENQGSSSRDTIQALIGQVYEFTEYSELGDDVTIISIRRDKTVGDIVIF
jgi:serine phosphatase RsbU (regulator of sigma subunit)/DNA-binding response OmpR family regulator